MGMSIASAGIANIADRSGYFQMSVTHVRRPILSVHRNPSGRNISDKSFVESNNIALHCSISRSLYSKQLRVGRLYCLGRYQRNIIS
jgi:hypothetical protein